MFISNLNAYTPLLGDYPFNTALQKIKPYLQQVADKKFLTLGDYTFYHSKFRVYVQLKQV